MLTNKEFELAVKVLIAYEEAYFSDSQKIGDIAEGGLYWDSKKECFSMDWGFALRGQAEDLRIYRGVEDYMTNKTRPVNQYDASVVYEGEVYFFEITEPGEWTSSFRKT